MNCSISNTFQDASLRQIMTNYPQGQAPYETVRAESRSSFHCQFKQERQGIQIYDVYYSNDSFTVLSIILFRKLVKFRVSSQGTGWAAAAQNV